MICDKFEQLTPSERAWFLGSICHIAQSDDAIFDSCKQLIELGTRKGLFDRVVIMPGINPTDNDTNTNGVPE